MRDSKKLESFLKEKEIKNKQQEFVYESFVKRLRPVRMALKNT
jgi:hypothetical protein